MFMEKPQQPQTPYEIIHNNTTYIHIPETEYFYNANSPLDDKGNPQEKYTFYKLLKKLSPQLYRSMSLKYTMPQELSLIGGASRIRVYRAVQLHYNTPLISSPISSFIQNTITPALQYLTDNAANQRKIQRQYNGARWAVSQIYNNGDNSGNNDNGNNKNHIDNLAAALFYCCGRSPRFDSQTMQGTSIHRIKPDKEGITIEIGNPHNLQTRFNAGVSAIHHAINNSIINIERINPVKLLKAAMRVFYAYNGWFLSISNAYHMSVRSAYGEYINELLTAFTPTQRPQIPDIIEPTNLLPPQTVFLPYSAFIKTDLSTAQIQQRQNNAYNKLYAACIQKAKRLLLTQDTSQNTSQPAQPTNQYTTKQLAAVGLEGKSLQSALKPDNGILRRVGRGVYVFSDDFWNEVKNASG